MRRFGCWRSGLAVLGELLLLLLHAMARQCCSPGLEAFVICALLLANAARHAWERMRYRWHGLLGLPILPLKQM